MDALKTFDGDGWCLLKIHTLVDTAICYDTMGDAEKFLRTCAQIACARQLLSQDDKIAYFVKMMETSKKLGKITRVFVAWPAPNVSLIEQH